MKRSFTWFLTLLVLFTLSACNQDTHNDVTTQPTTIPVSTTSPISSGSRLDTLTQAYNTYAQKDTSAYPLSEIVFSCDGEYFIIDDNGRMYPYFEEGAQNSSKVSQFGQVGLYYCPDLSGAMVHAMQNAWNAYASQCAQNHEPVYDQQLYLFECDYFNGVYAIGPSNQLIQNLALSGINCGKFGPFTLYVPENAEQAQPGTMTDGERTVIIRNVYAEFAADMALDAEECKTIEYYIFEYLGVYYRLDGDLSQVEADAAGELAADKFYNGWQVYLPAETVSES